MESVLRIPTTEVFSVATTKAFAPGYHGRQFLIAGLAQVEPSGAHDRFNFQLCVRPEALGATQINETPPNQPTGMP
jgi:hypothetical protein